MHLILVTQNIALLAFKTSGINRNTSQIKRAKHVLENITAQTIRYIARFVEKAITVEVAAHQGYTITHALPQRSMWAMFRLMN